MTQDDRSRQPLPPPPPPLPPSLQAYSLNPGAASAATSPTIPSSPYAAPPPPVDVLPQSVAVDAAGTVLPELPCRKCAYNLRGLNVRGRCPECGTPVGLSVHGKLLRFSDPKWLMGLRRGINFILIAMVIGVVGGFIGGFLSAVAGTVGVLIIWAATLVTAGLQIVGAWLLTEPDPSGIGEDEYGSARRFIRVTIVIGAVNTLLTASQQLVGLPKDISTIVTALTTVGALIGLAGTFAQLWYLSKLALRLPDQELSNRARMLMWWFPATYAVVLVLGAVITWMGPRATAASPGGVPTGAAMGLLCALGIVGIAALVFVILYLILLIRLANRFATESAAAAQTWAMETQSETASA